MVNATIYALKNSYSPDWSEHLHEQQQAQPQEQHRHVHIHAGMNAVSASEAYQRLLKVAGKPISYKTDRVLDLWHRHKSLPSSAIAERVGLPTPRVLQIITAARKRGDPRAEWRTCRS
jgi:hypothetical protein